MNDDPRELRKQGARALSAVSGLDPVEIAWTSRRLKALMEHGYSEEDAKRMVAQEAKKKPWIGR